MGFGVGYGPRNGAIIGDVTGTKTLSSTVNLTDGWNTITHNLGSNFAVFAWFLKDNTGNYIDVNPPVNLTANSFQALVAGDYPGATILVMYKKA